MAKQISLLILVAITASLNIFKSVQAKPISANDGTGTNITNPIGNPNQFDIGGGTQAGKNLFHSFQQFGLSEGQIANFLSKPNIQNILGRVTGGDASVINGIIQVSGGNSNLYLINPAGIIFGKKSSINIPGSFTATTANGIKIGDFWFDALGDNNYANLVGNPQAFAFTSDTPGTIINSGNINTVGNGNSITLVGGLVINTGTLETESGDINITAVPGKQLVEISQDGSLLSLGLPLAVENQLTPVSDVVTATSLPELLTGGDITEAVDVVVDNGVVKLKGEAVEVVIDGDRREIGNTVIPTQPGTVILTGDFNTGADDKSQIRVSGRDLEIFNPGITSDIFLEATNNIIFPVALLIGGDPNSGEVPEENLNIDLNVIAGNDIVANGEIVNPSRLLRLFPPLLSTFTGDERAGVLHDLEKKGLGTIKLTAENDIKVQDIHAATDVELISKNGNIIIGSADKPVIVSSSYINGRKRDDDEPTLNRTPGKVIINASNGKVELFGTIISGRIGKEGDSIIAIDAKQFVAKDPFDFPRLRNEQGEVIEENVPTSLLAFPNDVPVNSFGKDPSNVEFKPGKAVVIFEDIPPNLFDQSEQIIGEFNPNNEENVPTLITITLRPKIQDILSNENIFVIRDREQLDNNPNISGIEGEIVIGQSNIPPEVISVVNNTLFAADPVNIVDQELEENDKQETRTEFATFCGGDYFYSPVGDGNSVLASCPGQILSFVFAQPTDESGNPMEIKPIMFPELLTPKVNNFSSWNWQEITEDSNITFHFSSWKLD